VIKHALAAALALTLGGAAHATAIDLTPATVAAAAATSAASEYPSIFLLSWKMSELPEPTVFAMMLVGLVLIGFRARRHSSEKFK
jgi:archaellum biogenesis protein FlaJ (TadC family)